VAAHSFHNSPIARRRIHRGSLGEKKRSSLEIRISRRRPRAANGRKSNATRVVVLLPIRAAGVVLIDFLHVFTSCRHLGQTPADLRALVWPRALPAKGPRRKKRQVEPIRIRQRRAQWTRLLLLCAHADQQQCQQQQQPDHHHSQRCRVNRQQQQQNNAPLAHVLQLARQAQSVVAPAAANLDSKIVKGKLHTHAEIVLLKFIFFFFFFLFQ
jgi:hypothetical protein